MPARPWVVPVKSPVMLLSFVSVQSAAASYGGTGAPRNNELLVKRHSLITSHSSFVDTRQGLKNKQNSSTAEAVGGEKEGFV